MAKKSMVERELKRAKLAARYAAKRADIKAQLQKAYAADQTDQELIMQLQMQLQELPVNSSKSRRQRRCRITGRPRGVYRKFGLGRNKLREYAMMGLIPGLEKASW